MKFATTINEERNYHELKESIRMMKDQRGKIERHKLIKDGMKMGIHEIIKQNERITNNL